MNAIVIAMSLIMTTVGQMEEAGFIFSGTSPDGNFVEMLNSLIIRGL